MIHVDVNDYSYWQNDRLVKIGECVRNSIVKQKSTETHPNLETVTEEHAQQQLSRLHATKGRNAFMIEKLLRN